MNTVITKTWNTPSGINVEVKGELVLEKQINLDGQIDTVPACEIKLNVYANGKPQGRHIDDLTPAQKKQLPASYVARVGQLPLTSEHVSIISSVKAELEQHPAWIAKQAQIAKNKADIAAYNSVLETVKVQEGM